MPARETYGAQPPVELLRQFQDFKGFYDREKLFWKDIEDTSISAACAPPGGGRQPLAPRFVRHFTLLCMPAPSEACMKTILSSIFNGFLTDFSPELRTVSGPIVNATVEAYTRCEAEIMAFVYVQDSIAISGSYQYEKFELHDTDPLFECSSCADGFVVILHVSDVTTCSMKLLRDMHRLRFARRVPQTTARI